MNWGIFEAMKKIETPFQPCSCSSLFNCSIESIGCNLVKLQKLCTNLLQTMTNLCFDKII
jgi:hypothetical protein